MNQMLETHAQTMHENVDEEGDVEDDPNLIDEEEFAKLFKSTMDALVQDRFESFDASIKEFSNSINELHSAILETREQQKLILEEQQARKYLQEGDVAQNEFVENSNTTSPRLVQDSHKGHKIGNFSSRERVSIVHSQSMPSLSSPYRYVADSKLGSPTFCDRQSNKFGQPSPGLDRGGKKRMERGSRYQVQSLHKKK